MESNIKLTKDDPRKKANVFSLTIFAWVREICIKANRGELKLSDLYKCANTDDSQKLGDLLQKHWESELDSSRINKKEPKLLKAIFKTFLKELFLFGCLQLLSFVLRCCQPILLAIFINSFALGEEMPLKNKLLYGIALILLTLLYVFMFHHSMLGTSRTGMRVRISCSTLIYRKLLGLNNKSLNTVAAGKVVNLLSNDVSRFDVVAQFINFIWILPIQFAVIIYFLVRQVGISAAAGCVTMGILTLPLQGILAKLASTFRLKIAKRTDNRVKVMNEIVSGVQVIKMYAWEKPFAEVVHEARCSELKMSARAAYIRAYNASSTVFLERFVLFVTIVCYALLGNTVTADIVFSVAQLYNNLQLGMAICYPLAMTLGAEALVSVKRLQEFLLLEDKKSIVHENYIEKAVHLKNITAGWTLERLTLKDLNVYIPPGTLCAIVGPVGSGKSSVLQLILGELISQTGKLEIGGKISYASQQPWLFVSTVRKNILFGQEYDKKRYQDVVKVCALEKDFKQFVNGDKTFVGERGVSMSGGQKARINLARAVYREADIYLLDDPLSAVDAHVGKHLFDQCILGYLAGKTRILVTHQLQYLKKADMIIVLNDGKVEAQGSFSSIINSNLDFTKMFKAAEDETGEEKGTKNPRKDSIRSISSLVSEEDVEAKQEEIVAHKSSVYWKYARAGGNVCVLISLLCIMIVGQLFSSAVDYWSSFWTAQEERRTYESTECVEYNFNLTGNESFNNPALYEYNPPHDCNPSSSLLPTEISIYIYTALAVGCVITTLSRALFFYRVCINASRRLHSRMFSCLLQAPMRFFDNNPSGRILNRFSRDIGIIDELLPRFIFDAAQVILIMFGIIINVIISNYWMAIAVVIIGVIFLKVRQWYVTVARDMKHLEGIAKSPVFSHLTASLNGVHTIRASKMEKVVMKEFDEHQDTHTSAWFLSISCMVAFGLWLDLLSIIFLICVVLSFTFMSMTGAISGSAVGLAVSQTLILTGMVQHGIRQSAEAVSQMASVERVLEYTKLEKEGPAETPKDKKPPKHWPSKGKIEFKNFFLYYSREDPPVLKNLDFTVNATEKVGIVGRTGAGKSSLIAALFRLTESEGSIYIDGIDTNNVGLNELRKSISIIPQEPVLFSATMRYNLDPFKEFKDDDLWRALEEVELKESVPTLDYMIQEGGSNFSVGQRQLICLARALLRRNKILVLDEATANVDLKTDSLIQETIRRKFKECTVLTIAHRLNTVMDSDKVLVMDTGKAVEYDHPYKLLQNKNGHLYKMIAQTGPNMVQELHNVATKTFMDRIKEEKEKEEQ